MAQLTVRNLDARLVRALKIRAAKSGRSAEAEHREILRNTLRPHRAESLEDYLLAMPDVGEDKDFVRPSGNMRDVDL